MKCAITDTGTGEARIYEDEYPYSEFIWNEGNYSCDCNRGLFFARAGGREPGLHEFTCNVGPNRFTVEIIEDTDAQPASPDK